MEYGSLGKLKVTDYAIQQGVMEGETFVPFEEECDKVKTYEELATRKGDTFPNDASLGYHYVIYSD